MIIALDGEDILRSLGACDVYIASSVERAVAVIDSERIDHAILDFNLGSETSLAAAEMLLLRGIRLRSPRDMVTRSTSQRGCDVQIIRKPYNTGGLSAAIAIGISLKP